MDEKENMGERFKVPVTYSVIFDYIGDLKRCLEEGESLANSTFIVDCCIVARTVGKIVVKSFIFQSVTSKPPHEILISIQVVPCTKIISAKCTCKAGLSGTCKHAVATLLYVHQKEVPVEPSSCTSERQTWGKELKLKAAALHPPQPVEDMHCFRAPHAEKSKIKSNTQRARKTIMANLAYMPSISRHFDETFRPLMKKTVSPQTPSPIDFFKKLLMDTSSVPYPPTHEAPEMSAEDDRELQELLVKEVFISLERSMEIISAPQQSRAWFDARRYVITGTAAAKIISSTNLHRTALALRKNFNGNAATMYGNKMEPYARKEFERTQVLKVNTCGLVVNQSWNHLAFSPDGIVLGSSLELLEIKCPQTAKDKPIIGDNGLSNVDYVNVNKNGIELSKSARGYYNQVQYGMYVLNLKKCHFYVYSPKGSATFVVPRDDEFLSRVVPKIHEFYYLHFLPMLLAELPKACK